MSPPPRPRTTTATRICLTSCGKGDRVDGGMAVGDDKSAEWMRRVSGAYGPAAAVLLALRLWLPPVVASQARGENCSSSTVSTATEPDRRERENVYRPPTPCCGRVRCFCRPGTPRPVGAAASPLAGDPIWCSTLPYRGEPAPQEQRKGNNDTLCIGRSRSSRCSIGLYTCPDELDLFIVVEAFIAPSRRWVIFTSPERLARSQAAECGGNEGLPRSYTSCYDGIPPSRVDSPPHSSFPPL